MVTIIILGGGFGGLAAANKLLKTGHNVILISDTDHFLYTPLLHEVAAGEVLTEHISVYVRDFLKGDNFRFIRAKVSKVDAMNQEVYYNKSKIQFDILLIATGSRVNYYGIKGADKYTYNMKIKDEVAKLKRNIKESLEKTTATDDEEELEKLLTFVIAGAGPTGIEYSGDLAEYLKKQESKYPAMKKKKQRIFVLNAAKDILPIMHDKSRNWVKKRLEKKGITLMNESPITEVGEDYVVIAGKDKIFSNTIVWSAGVTPNELPTEPKLQDERGYFQIDTYLRVKGKENIFAIGDASFLPNVPPLAQSARDEGLFVADNIIRAIEKKELKEFKFNNKGILISIGKYYGIAELRVFGNIVYLQGIIPRVLKRAVYLMGLPTLKAKLYLLHDWVNSIF